MTLRATCPSCGGRRLSEIYQLDNIPVQSCILLDTKAEALAFPRHDMRLTFCDECGFIFNAAFDLSLVDYASATEESQHFSGTFNSFARSLINEIAGRYELDGRQTLEIGCGKGDFLWELVQRTNTLGFGVDPGFTFDRWNGRNDGRLTFQRAYFDPTTAGCTPDFIVCRHTLEHIPEVGRFLAGIAQLVEGRHGVHLFFETPDAKRVLAEGAFWDIYYEHCSYFTLGSHARLFRSTGMDVTKLWLGYDGQYILQFAETTDSERRLPGEDDLDEVRKLVAAFPRQVESSRSQWAEFVRRRHAAGKRVTIWGGGSKAVAFLTSNDLGDAIASVVDVNPYKQGKHLPGSGHRVCEPRSLRASAPDTVIVMNPVYRREIEAELQAMGLSPEIVGL